MGSRRRTHTELRSAGLCVRGHSEPGGAQPFGEAHARDVVKVLIARGRAGAYGYRKMRRALTEIAGYCVSCARELAPRVLESL